MNNYRMIIEYDGTNYFGWQSQISGQTIQDEIQKAIFTLTNIKVNVVGSGRTDSGVHSLGQVANFRINTNLELKKFEYSLNAILPNDIKIRNFEETTLDFNSRFDAKHRIYYYLITNRKSPFLNNYSYFFYYLHQLNINDLKILSKPLLGEHDFTSFCRKNTEITNKICDISYINWKQFRDLVIFRIEANRFLHGMVRTLVGTLLNAAINKKGPDYIKEILEMKDRKFAGQSFLAKGLFLYKVKY